MTTSQALSNATNETVRARRAWTDYLSLGPDRSIERLLDMYRLRTGSAPTLHITTLKRWSRQFSWQARLVAIADQELAAAETAERAHIRAVLETGYAQVHERVAVLKELAECLRRELLDEGRLWLSDAKGIGGGDNWTQVDIKRFNSAELEQLRGLLDDIARETGGRPRTVKVDIEHRIRTMALEMGLDPDSAVSEAQRWLQ